MPFEDLTGKKFNRLTVIEELRGQKKVKCRCDCGKIVICNKSKVKNGIKKSCGCIRDGIDLTGFKTGKLTVIKKMPKKGWGVNKWLCQCECGNTTVLNTTQLTHGYVQSCGCALTDFNKKFMKAYHAKDKREGTSLKMISSEKPLSNNKLGIRGVCQRKETGKYIAYMRFKGKSMFLGSFVKLEDAIEARKKAEEKYFKPIIKKYAKEKATGN